MSQRLFLLIQDVDSIPRKTAFETGHYDHQTSNHLGIWIIAGLVVILIGFIFVKAINHKEAKTDWPKFFIIYGVVCAASLVFYLIIHDY